MIIKPIPGVGGGVNTPIYQPTYQLTAENWAKSDFNLLLKLCFLST
jgi:hypothetical protein